MAFIIIIIIVVIVVASPFSYHSLSTVVHRPLGDFSECAAALANIVLLECAGI